MAGGAPVGSSAKLASMSQPAVDAIAPIGNDQLCYVKEAGDWKIGGYVGTGDVP